VRLVVKLVGNDKTITNLVYPFNCLAKQIAKLTNKLRKKNVVRLQPP
jgi:hypothetical protein